MSVGRTSFLFLRRAKKNARSTVRHENLYIETLTDSRFFDSSFHVHASHRRETHILPRDSLEVKYKREIEKRLPASYII
jgi:hypothetical protein